MAVFCAWTPSNGGVHESAASVSAKDSLIHFCVCRAGRLSEENVHFLPQLLSVNISTRRRSTPNNEIRRQVLAHRQRQQRKTHCIFSLLDNIMLSAHHSIQSKCFISHIWLMEELHKETRFLIQANRTAYERNLRELKRRSHGKLFGKLFLFCFFTKFQCFCPSRFIGRFYTQHR